MKTYTNHEGNGGDCHGNSTEFYIKVEMGTRWVPHFLAMLKYMEQLGGWGSSRSVTFFADGDGDFRPKFTWEHQLPSDGKCVHDHDGNRKYDAG